MALLILIKPRIEALIQPSPSSFSIKRTNVVKVHWSSHGDISAGVDQCRSAHEEGELVALKAMVWSELNMTLGKI